MVHQVVIHVVRPQPGELLVEILVDRGAAPDQVLGQFGGDADLVPDAVALQDLAQRRFTAGVDVGGVKVIDPGLEGGQDLLFGLVDVDAGALAAEAHAAVAEDREGVAVFVCPVLHNPCKYR